MKQSLIFASTIILSSILMNYRILFINIGSAIFIALTAAIVAFIGSITGQKLSGKILPTRHLLVAAALTYVFSMALAYFLNLGVISFIFQALTIMLLSFIISWQLPGIVEKASP
jgi:hypothetical protein